MARKLCFLLFSAACLVTAAHAQENLPETAQQDIGRNPAVSMLMREYGISQQEAQMRIDLQEQIIAMSDKLNVEADPAYADIYIQHEPVYKIIVSFSDKKDRKAFLDNIDPKIRRYVQLKNTTKSRADVNRDLDTIAASLASSGITYFGGYDLPTAKFKLTTEKAADVQRIQSLLPANLKADVEVTTGPVPKTQAAPYGVVAGDSIMGGTTVRNATNTTAPYCTFGYAISYTSGSTTKRGILTAGHCTSATMYFSVNNHWVTLHTPIVDRPPAAGSKYDYKIWETTGLASSNRIYYRNLNAIPEFPASGTLSMTTITTFMNQKVGMVVCKSGATTGITCGKISDGNAIRNGAAGWITVTHTLQSDISEPGDSGGPWFLYPGTSTTISGVGIHTAGSGTATGTGSLSQYMPIDYIDDHMSSVNTVKQ
jgi:hypothetical protein